MNSTYQLPMLGTLCRQLETRKQSFVRSLERLLELHSRPSVSGHPPQQSKAQPMMRLLNQGQPLPVACIRHCLSVHDTVHIRKAVKSEAALSRASTCWP